MPAVASKSFRRLWADAIIIGPTNGNETLEKSIEVFPGGIINSNDLQIGLAGKPTPSMSALMYKITAEERLEEVLSGLDLNQLRLQEGQVVELCRSHSDHIPKDGAGTFFILTEGGERIKKDLSNVILARVGFDQDEGAGLFVELDDFDYDLIWYVGDMPTFVFPEA